MVKRKLRSMVELKEFLKNPSPNVKVPVYTEEEKSDINSGDHTVKRPTLSQRLDKLTELIELMNSRFDNLEKDVKNINIRLDRVENRLDQIEQRLDYNGLKQLPNSK